ncbi:hypothetical protein CPC08DRAFT_714281 [Agrocybe pediades]|nr:hypothetical protein CPC08DRAFT_714281 [Agrocybe pediades]
MIIIPDNSDTVSTNTLVQESQLEELPPFFRQLVYISACFSVAPFALGLYNVSQSKLYSIPTIFGYVCTTPFHVVGFFLILQDNRQIDMRLPFQTTSLKTIGHLCGETTIWLASTIACAVGSRLSVPKQSLACWHPGSQFFEFPGCKVTAAHGTHPDWTLLAASILSGLEAVLLSTITCLCFRHRRRILKKTNATLPTSERESRTKYLNTSTP